MRRPVFLLLAAAAAAGSVPASAEVIASSEQGFVSHNEALVAATPAQTWEQIVRPAGWWNGDHSYSGDPANMTLAPVAGGCFCEAIPAAGDAAAGEVEHMRVLYASPGRILRLRGSLGPLQSEAVTGVLTITLLPEDDMTRLRWEYVVGGYMRMPMAELAPIVDQVVGEQLLRLATRLGVKMDPVSRRGL